MSFDALELSHGVLTIFAEAQSFVSVRLRRSAVRRDTLRDHWNWFDRERRWAAKRAIFTRTACEFCGEFFSTAGMPSVIRGPVPRFCNSKCRAGARRGTFRGPFLCPHCGHAYFKPFGVHFMKYCSQTCSSAAAHIRKLRSARLRRKRLGINGKSKPIGSAKPARPPG